MSGGVDGLATVMQQSLNPRKPERSSGHYPDKGAVVAAYKRMVSSIQYKYYIRMSLCYFLCTHK